jgi:hypothetical protein
MSEQNETIFRRLIQEVWNEGREETIDELFDRNAVAMYPIGLEEKPLYGIDEYRQFVRFVRRNCRTVNVSIEQIAADEEKVVSFCRMRAELIGHGSGTEGRANLVETAGLCQIIIRDGKIVSTWSNFDLRQFRAEDLEDAP